MAHRALLYLVLLTTPFLLSAQDKITRADYDRALSFLRENVENKRIFNAHVSVNWLPDSTGFWYVDHAPGKQTYLRRELGTEDYAASPLFDHAKLAAILADSLGKEVAAEALPIDRLEYAANGKWKIHVGEKGFTLSTEDYSLTPLSSEPASPSPHTSVSPDSSWIAYTQAYNLYLVSPKTARVRPLSSRGEKGYEYGSWIGWADIIEGENGERPERFYADWSPDGEWLATYVVDLRNADKMLLLDWSVDTLYRPRLLSYYRGSPGDTNMVYLEPVFFNVETGREIRVDLPRATHINSVGTLWSEETPGLVYLFHQNRGYQDMSIYTFDLKTEKLTLLYAEESATNIDNFRYRAAEKAGKLFFLSEKSGWRQLHALDLKTGGEQMLTEGGYFITDIVRVDEGAQRVYFRAAGKNRGENPYHQRLYSVGFAGEDLKELTAGDGHHRTDLSPDGRYFVDNVSTLNRPTRTLLVRTADGEVVAEIARARLDSLEDWSPPEVFTALAHDGETTIYGAIWKPTNFDPARKYPVIDASYTGPHTYRTPVEFRWATGPQSYAELGFVVVTVDGLGSAGRSKAFHNHSYRNLGGGLEDHVGAIRQLGERYAWVDTSRVGIFGHSAGGYDAGRAVLAYPDFYKVAVASSADHDHRMEKAWWPEMYMGWPVDSVYEQQSNITMAGNLRGKLLITHGGIDENVNPSATFKLAEALIRENKEFDMLILPSQRHGYSGQAQKYFVKKRWNYFLEHLRGVEPIWDIGW